MERRDILKYAASITGVAICAPLTTSLLVGCSSEKPISMAVAVPLADKKPAFFDQEAFKLLTQLMDVILPRTDTPSASDVEVSLIMDNMFNKVFEDDYRQDFLKRFVQLKDYLETQNFAISGPKEQLAVVKTIEATPDNEKNSVFRSYIDIKQQTISYYLATEEVAEKHLNYLPIPGGYTPCISLEEAGGKAWAE